MSLLLTNNTTSSALTAGGQIPLGTAIHGCGKNVRLNGNAITVTGSGYYLVTVSATVAVTGTGAETIQLYDNGSAVAGALASANPSEAGATVDIAFTWIVRNVSCCQSIAKNLTLVSSATGTLNNLIVTVTEI